jgi:hypothetical protein
MLMAAFKCLFKREYKALLINVLGVITQCTMMSIYCLCLFTVFYDYFKSSIGDIQGRVMAFNATFNTIQLYRGGQLYWSGWLANHFFF